MAEQLLTRAGLRKAVAERKPSADYDGVTRDSAQMYVRQALKILRKARREPTRSAVRDVTNLIKNEQASWPDGEPDTTIGKLVKVATLQQKHDPRRRVARRTLELFLFEFDRVIGSGAESRVRSDFKQDLENLLSAIINKLDEDYNRRRVGRATDLAKLLAANFPVIHSTELRNHFLATLDDLVTERPQQYSDPFLVDLLIVHRQGLLPA